MKRLLLLGGGHAHVHVLQALALEPLQGTEVHLVSPYSRQMYSGMVPGLVAGHYRVEDCAIALAPLAQAAGVHFTLGEAVAIDAALPQVRLSSGETLSCDVLSLDTGAVMSRQRLPGAQQHGLFVRPIESFVQLLDRLSDLAQERALNVVVVGAGAAGVELALALQHRLCGPRRGSSPGPHAAHTRVALVTGGDVPLAGYAQGVVRRAMAVLARERITVFRDSVAAIESQHVMLGSGARVACDAAVLATGAEAPAWLAGSGLALNEKGFVVTGPTLQSASHAHVFAVGDVATRSDTPHPKSGVYAVRAGPALAVNLRRYAAGEPLLPHQPQTRTLNLISCGRKSAIVSWGSLHAQGRWAWWWKDHIDRAFVARYGITQGPSGAATAR